MSDGRLTQPLTSFGAWQWSIVIFKLFFCISLVSHASLPPVMTGRLCNLVGTSFFQKKKKNNNVFKRWEVFFQEKLNWCLRRENLTGRTNVWHRLIDLIVPIMLGTNLHNKICKFWVSGWQIVFHLGNIRFITAKLVFEYQRGCCCLITRGASMAGVPCWLHWRRCSRFGQQKRKYCGWGSLNCYFRSERNLSYLWVPTGHFFQRARERGGAGNFVLAP